MNIPYPNLYHKHLLLIFISFCIISLVHAENWVYKVRKDDNLWNITTDHLIDISYVKRIQKLNNISDPLHLQPGTQIIIPRAWIRHYPAIVRVLNLQGTAKIIEDESKQFRPIKIGEMAMLGDTLITESDSTLMLGFLDGSRILLQENSRLKVERLMLLENTGMSDTRLQLKSGRMETQVIHNPGNARQFQIKTPVTVTSVRGTDYRISAEVENKESKTEVVQGKVIVEGMKKGLTLTTGFGTITKKDQEPLPPIKLMPAPDISQLPKTLLQVPLQFIMPEPEENHGYRVQIAKTQLFQDVLFDKKFYKAIIRGPDLPDGNYHFRVRSFDDLQLEGYNAQFPIIINARPEAPFLITPKLGFGFLLEEKPQFSWSRQQEINQYHLQISNNQDFTDVLIDIPEINDNKLTINHDLALGKYYWRVAASDQEGDGPFSDGQLFRRILPAPELKAPDITDDSLTIRSRKGLPGQIYHFQLSDEANFSELLVDKRTDKPFFETSKPNAGEYFVRVRTIDPDGFEGPFSSPQSIEIPYNLYWLLVLLPLIALIAL